MEGMTQEELLKAILKEKEKHPEMEIHFLCDTDTDPDYEYAVQKISTFKIEPWFCDEERVVHADREKIMDYLMHSKECINISCVEKIKRAEKKYEAEVKHAICVYFTAV